MAVRRGRDLVDLDGKTRSQKEGVNEKPVFFYLPTVGVSLVFVVGGKVILAGIASDLLFCNRGREASALLVVVPCDGFCRRRKVGYQLIVT